MSDFQKTAQIWLQHRAEQDQKTHQPLWEVSRCGRVFPLAQKMEIRSEHAVLSLHCGLGREGIGREFCYYDLCPCLNTDTLKPYFHLVEQLAEQDTDSHDPHHDYTFSSLVLLTEHFQDHEAQKALKRYRFQRQFAPENQEYGWNTCQVCVVDLAENKIWCSAMGDALKNRMEGNLSQSVSLGERLRKRINR